MCKSHFPLLSRPQVPTEITARLIRCAVHRFIFRPKPTHKFAQLTSRDLLLLHRALSLDVFGRKQIYRSSRSSSVFSF
ncbi:hypothetical protein Q7C36_014111 [Tachysurus vachellii]|uniref:Uncharacterized protein n=1 Tax=Tachysurus vachellii TaxID=175792 RepID=A0AA88ME40_TACVA|nr:hypothetical protein Q7C36_014111 [Tachysurus vachellii]